MASQADVRRVDNVIQLSNPEKRNLGVSQTPSGSTFVDTEFGNLDQAVQRESTANKYGISSTSEQAAILAEQDAAFEGMPDAVDESKKPTVDVGPAKKIINTVGVPNPLHDLPSYSYNISLHVLSPDHYKQTLATGQYVPDESVLIGGAGRYSSTTPDKKIRNPHRAPAFQDVDFYINDLKMFTVIGANQQAQNSNVLTLSFTIIEPNGATLMNRIIDTAKFIKEKYKYSSEPNHLDLPYLLEVEFVGYDENGVPLPSRSYKYTKYIPIKILGMKFKITAKGAEYKCDCVAFNHHGMSNTVATVPVNINVVASTVGDFFAAKSSLANVNELSGNVDSDSVRTQSVVENKTKEGRADEAKKAAEEYKNKVYKVSSYTDAIDAAYDLIKTYRNFEESDNIEFVVDPEIAKSPIMSTDASASIKTVPMSKEGEASAAKPGTIDKKQVSISINAGTNLLQVIETIILGSEYIREQVVDPANSADAERFKKMLEEKKKLNWFRIIPEVVLKKYDPARSEFGKTFRYHIVKWPLTNNLIKYANHGIPDIVQKSYNYIFTGENNDIIDFQLDFDMLYYVSTTLVREQLKKDQVQQDDADTTSNKKSPDSGSRDNEEVTKAKVSADKNKETRPDNFRVLSQVLAPNLASGSVGPKDAKTAVVYDTRNALLSNSRGDMINVKLKIVGDPHLFKQDDFFYPPHKRSEFEAVPVIDAHVTPNESLVTDSGELYAFLNFKTPKDFSDSTGLLDYDSKYIESPFKGFFKILTVESTFNNGKFEQTLDLIRLPDQEAKLKEVEESQRKETEKPIANNGRATDVSLPAQEPPKIDIASTIKQVKNEDEVAKNFLNDLSNGKTPQVPLTNMGIFNTQQPVPTQAHIDEANKINAEAGWTPASGIEPPITASQVAANSQINRTITKSLGLPEKPKPNDPFANLQSV